MGLVNENKKASGADASDGPSPSGKRETSKAGWDDPNVPIGNAPPLPRWPLLVSGAAWLGWVVFLVAMLMTRTQAAAS